MSDAEKKAVQTETAVVTDEELGLLMARRSATYDFLSRLYATEVDQGLLDQMGKMLFPVDTGSEEMDEGYRLMAHYLSNVPANVLIELAIDYVRCFIGHGNDAYGAAYPYESVYTSEKRLMMQDARDEVLAIYRSEKLDKPENWKVPEDHVALELAFMGELSRRAEGALRNSDSDEVHRLLGVQLAFLDEHLYAWAGMMTSDLKKFARSDLYQGLAHLTDGFLASDYVFLSAVCEGAGKGSKAA